MPTASAKRPSRGRRQSDDAPDINALEPTLTRYGYNVKALSELLNVRADFGRALLYGQLPEERAAELKQQILKTGIPL
jgi:N-acetyl-anhydromuramyl-L-alanine amidase AmpD